MHHDWFWNSKRTTISFYSKKDLKLIKNWEIQVIVFMIMLTRSSGKIINPIRYTGQYLHA